MSIVLCALLLECVNLFAERAEGFSGENGFDRKSEKLAEPEDEFEGWDVVTTLEEANCLRVDAYFRCESLPTDGTLGAKHGYAVMDHMIRLRKYYIA
jgi:hypothetical protein